MKRSFPGSSFAVSCQVAIRGESRAIRVLLKCIMWLSAPRRAAEAAEATVRLGGAQWRHHSTCLRTKWPLLMMERMGISASVSHLEDRILHVVNTRCQNIEGLTNMVAKGWIFTQPTTV